MNTQSWIENHPNATHLERIEAIAHSLVGKANEPTSSAIEWYGLPEDWSIYDEPLEICLAFDNIVMRCEDCDWWCAFSDLDEGVCSECQSRS